MLSNESTKKKLSFLFICYAFYFIYNHFNLVFKMADSGKYHGHIMIIAVFD
jgi:hypothetical protein